MGSEMCIRDGTVAASGPVSPVVVVVVVVVVVLAAHLKQPE